ATSRSSLFPYPPLFRSSPELIGQLVELKPLAHLVGTIGEGTLTETVDVLIRCREDQRSENERIQQPASIGKLQDLVRLVTKDRGEVEINPVMGDNPASGPDGLANLFKIRSDPDVLFAFPAIPDEPHELLGLHREPVLHTPRLNVQRERP